MKGSDVKKVVVACDAGMGSSVMLATQVRKSLKKSGVTVEHTPVSSIPADADVILTHASMVERARAGAPDKQIVAFNVFIGDPAVTRVVEAIKKGAEIPS